MTQRGGTSWLRQTAADIRHLHNIDAYAISFLTFCFAVLSVIGDILPGNVRWAVLLAGMGVLVFRVARPQLSTGRADEVLQDRHAFEDTPFAGRLRDASELWVFAPSAVNLLSPQTCETVRSTLLASKAGVVRVVVLDPAAKSAIRQATLQLDDDLDYPPQLFLTSLQATIGQLQRLASQGSDGFAYRLLDFNPGFSLVAIDPTAADGQVIVEFHGFHSESMTSRMHVELTREDGGSWYGYWLDQFERIWRAARPPDDSANDGVAAPLPRIRPGEDFSSKSTERGAHNYGVHARADDGESR